MRRGEMARKRRPTPLNNTRRDIANNTSTDFIPINIPNARPTLKDTNGPDTHTNATTDKSNPGSDSSNGAAVIWLQPSAYNAIRSLWQDSYVWSPVAVDASLTPDRTSFILMDDANNTNNDTAEDNSNTDCGDRSTTGSPSASSSLPILPPGTSVGVENDENQKKGRTALVSLPVQKEVRGRAGLTNSPSGLFEMSKTDREGREVARSSTAEVEGNVTKFGRSESKAAAAEACSIPVTMPLLPPQQSTSGLRQKSQRRKKNRSDVMKEHPNTKFQEEMGAKPLMHTVQASGSMRHELTIELCLNLDIDVYLSATLKGALTLGPA
ncbi:hypothetical protein F5Y19DRAFT_46582 [Xylariaceae sp. FL1651]|nr:hypothetical protein F5Y19DRAFT_46582 [Xylariaceae sp. FL1651]